MEKRYTSLNVYQISYRLSMEIFEISKSFPNEEKYSLTDQIRRSACSVPVNIANAYRRRKSAATAYCQLQQLL